MSVFLDRLLLAVVFASIVTIILICLPFSFLAHSIINEIVMMSLPRIVLEIELYASNAIKCGVALLI